MLGLALLSALLAFSQLGAAPQPPARLFAGSGIQFMNVLFHDTGKLDGLEMQSDLDIFTLRFSSEACRGMTVRGTYSPQNSEPELKNLLGHEIRPRLYTIRLPSTVFEPTIFAAFSSPKDQQTQANPTFFHVKGGNQACAEKWLTDHVTVLE